ncbi:MAG: DUF1080 domain-containing protein [Dysgonamonadaceae bacterium]|jgi:hypothetical protein|nr:DUF1080 domain-containing protein [Dysgonamonadaceae bacterium]
MKINHFILTAISVMLLVSGCEKKEQGINLAMRPISEWYIELKDSIDPTEVFSIEDGVIRARGDFGYIRTMETYSDYELSVEWRWINEATNSGIFVNICKDGIWPTMYEIQLKAGDAGDLINAGGATSNEYIANMADSTVQKPSIISKMNLSNENPVGEWNKAEITVGNDTITVWINGELQNQITGISSKSGYIGLQSEGKEIEFRNVIVKQK